MFAMYSDKVLFNVSYQCHSYFIGGLSLSRINACFDWPFYGAEKD